MKLEAYEDGVARVMTLEWLGDGATGAPVFSSDKELIGVYFKGNGQSCVISQRRIAEEMSKKPLSSNLKGHLMALMKVAVSPKAPTVPSILKPPLADIYSFSLSTNELLCFSHKGQKKGSKRIPVVLESGFSFLSTPRGLYITGLCFGQERFALLCRDGNIESLQHMTYPHSHHISVDYKGKLVVISGLNSNYMETLKGEKDDWGLKPLEWVRARASAVVLNETIYVFGGVGWNCKSWKRSILTYNGEKWEKSKFMLPTPFIDSGAFMENSSVLVLFGGFGEQGIPNNSIQYLNLRDGRSWKKDGKDLGCYGGLMPWKDGERWVAINSEGSVLVLERGEISWLFEANTITS